MGGWVTGCVCVCGAGGVHGVSLCIEQLPTVLRALEKFKFTWKEAIVYPDICVLKEDVVSFFLG